ncbi:peptidoglycan/LPS O-acetylase OafA/YrhL [Pseudomonas duriflava]|uniref:Peptidoglycan/LPS O-acetylase OafA/YrhL n=1 Tax=Pseudomonas duriflava TaxID=459528 RepID=A0A562QDY4_9PSED|nr:acyltransferase family protein [Pseudomonas duriflava]TWI54380.1 peptidoglycan/LPS O-acetylase OafA/YrhL [Pseudomonas duriflava]
MDIGYRRDIDGLRALAVLFVVLNHVGMDLFAGGYIGVDVFFVISGYLITKKTVLELESQAFSFTSFYVRRVRRLLPAFVVVALVTSLMALVILLPNDLAHYSRSLIAALLSVSNVYFWHSSGGYFSPTADELPLLHTWSLAVEEQYYILWPVCLVLGYRFLSRRTFTYLTGVGLLAAIVLSEWMARSSPDAAYYLLPARMFELLIGSVLALYGARLPALGRLASEAVSLVGLGLILGAGFTLSEGSRFPGLNALWPCLGAALLIWAGESHLTMARRLLSLRPLVFIGIISYSLYLWHWPLIAFAHYIELPWQAATQIALVILSIGVAILSWKFVELPFRFKYKFPPLRTYTLLYGTPLCLGAVLVLAVWQTQGLPQRYDTATWRMIDAVNQRFETRPGNCFVDEFGTAVLQRWSPEKCRLGDVERPKPDVLLVGDSHAAASLGMIDVLLKDAGLRGYDMTRSGTVYLPGLDKVYITRPGNRMDPSIELTHPVITEAIRSGGYKYVIMGGRWPMYLQGMNEPGLSAFNRLQQGPLTTTEQSVALLRTGLENALKIVEASGAIPVIIEGIPEIGVGQNTCVIKNRLFDARHDCSVPRAAISERQARFDALLAELKRKHPALITLDPKETLCDSERCYSALDDTPVYMDGNHLNSVGSQMVGRLMLKHRDNPLSAVDRKALSASS